jgi:hypothetical protein
VVVRAAAAAAGVVEVVVWVAAVVVAVAVVKGEAMAADGGDIDAGTNSDDDLSLPDSVDADSVGS